MSPKDKLTNLLREYVTCIAKQIERLKHSWATVKYTPMGRRATVLEAIEFLESQPVFGELVKATMLAYKGKSRAKMLTSMRTQVKHFFRRSGIYVDCFEKGRVEEFEGIQTLYEKAFTAREESITYLATLEGVSFTELIEGVTLSRKEPLDFGSFLIRRFSPEELFELVGNRSNEIFYPYATWDVSKLSWYWFLVTQRTEEVSKAGTIIVDFGDLDSIRRKPIPNEISVLCTALYKIVLFDWRPQGLQEEIGYHWHDLGINFSVERLQKHRYKLVWEPWYGFKVPIVGKIIPSLIDSPPVAPDTTRLETIPYFNHRGEEIDGPLKGFSLNEEETLKFEKSINDKVDLFNDRLLEEWPFFQVSLDYLTKAFLIDPFASAPEQLLWHITSLEALLGRSEDKEVVGPLARRLSRILGSNNSQRERIKYQFRKLYQVRSDLVHGNPWREYSSLYLYEARNFARYACLWFLKLARYNREQNKTLPSRDEILNGIDSGNILELRPKK